MKKFVWAVINLLLCYAFPYWVGFVVIMCLLAWIVLAVAAIAGKYDTLMQGFVEQRDWAHTRLSGIFVTTPGYLYLSTITTGTILGLAVSQIFIYLAISAILAAILGEIAHYEKYKSKSGITVEEV